MNTGEKTGPKVAVLLPVYNGERTIYQTIESLLAQTFSDYRIYACIDGSADGSEEIIRSFGDDRIHVVTNEKNLGLGRTLNRIVYGLTWRPDYLAMAEQDDYYYPDRLAMQVDMMDSCSDVGLCSGIAEFWDGNKVSCLFPGLLVHGGQYPNGRDMFLLNYTEQIKVVNSCAMIRSSVHMDNGLYFTSHYPSVSVDWSYILRFSLISKIKGLQEVLVRLDRSPRRHSVTSDKMRQFRAARELIRCFRYEYPDIITDAHYREALINQELLELAGTRGFRYVAGVLRRIMFSPLEARYRNHLISRLRRYAHARPT